MEPKKLSPFLVVFVVLAALVGQLAAQSRGLKAIRDEDMKAHLEFLAAKEFAGRNAPSAGLDIASRYIALVAQRAGLKPLLPGGSYLQDIPVEVTTISAAKSRLRIISAASEQTFTFPQAFGTSPRGAVEGAGAGGLVFVGSLPALPAAELEKSLAELPVDFRGKIAVVLTVPPPPATKPGGAAAVVLTRFLRAKGALGLISAITLEREKNLAEKGLSFDIQERLRFPDVETGIPGAAPAAPPASSAAQPQLQLPFYQVEVRHDAAAAILGISRAEIEKMFAAAGEKQAVTAKEIAGRMAEIALYTDTRRTTTPNVVGWIEGSDPKLKGEYIVIGSHHDHNPVREGRVYPGADDDGSGTVAMLELVEAIRLGRPKRSVIFVWHTAEEKGLIGAYYFVQHSPVPVEKISADLNLDMISRNEANMIYLIGSNKLSSELDRSIQAMNARFVKFKLDYTYESPTHPERFFFRSDHYPYIRYGVPGVWFFCGTTPDYHQETDTVERADFGKAEKAAKLVYLVALDIGNRPSLLKLDLNPEVTTRGAHNMKINWQRPPQPAEKR
jgi:hypothetical protein